MISPEVTTNQVSGNSVNKSTLSPSNLLSQTMVGNYRLNRKIGSGSMGVIYQGEEMSTGRPVALKVFNLDGSQKLSKQIIKQSFVQEVFTGGCLDHKNIVTFFDADVIDDHAVIIMEPLPGIDLQEQMKNGIFLSVKELIEVFMQCAEGLAHAHSKNIVHLDIKPSNLIYDRQTSFLRITDFGVAHHTGTSRATDKILGSPSYMSPEQVTGRPVDGRSDLFSLGVVMFHLITGRLPFIDRDLHKMMGKIVSQPHPSVSSLRCNLLPSLVDVIDTLLEKKLSNRYATATELVEALTHCMQAHEAGLK